VRYIPTQDGELELATRVLVASAFTRKSLEGPISDLRSRGISAGSCRHLRWQGRALGGGTRLDRGVDLNVDRGMVVLARDHQDITR